MVVQHNISGMNANRQLNITTGIQTKSSEKLSSGYKINRAADDAAGLAISEKMRRQIRGLSQASKNAQDGVSWCQIADGALDEVSNMVSRAKELAVKAANDTLTDDDRNYINEEMQKMASEIDRTHASTEFNNINVFSDDGFEPSSAMISPNANRMAITLPNGAEIELEISFDFIGNSGKINSVDAAQASGQNTSYNNAAYVKFVKDAASNAVGKLYNTFPNLFNAASSSGIKVGLDLHKKDANNVLATASIKLSSSGDSTMMQYSMFVDTIDFPISEFDSMSDAKKAQLASTIAHEMTHLAMYDTLTAGMLGGSLGTPFPDWFVEGVAQTSSGDDGWVTISGSSTDAEIRAYNSKMKDGNNVYGAGYVAAMYLGYAVSASAASPNTAVTSANINSGLDTLMTYMAENKKTLNEAIADKTGYSGLSDFENSFRNSTAKSATLDPLAFTRSLLQATGNGAGSLFGNFSDTSLALFAPGALNPSGSNYTVQSDSTWYANRFGDGIPFPDKTPGTATGEGGDSNILKLQVGSETGSMNVIDLKRFNIRLKTLSEGNTFDTTTRENALETIETVNIMGQTVARVRSYYGALQNRLEHTIKNLDNVVENTQSAESRIRDTDMATEMVKYSNNNILAQAGQAMLAQANQTNQGVLSLLQ